MPTPRPTAQQLEEARGRLLPDVVGPGLRVLFCGINPSLYAAAVGHHYARPGNRFWPALHLAGLTPRLLRAEEDGLLPAWGLGLTNVAARPTPSAAELSQAELQEGGRLLRQKLVRLQPRVLAVLGVGAYRSAFGQPHATFGEQPEGLEGTRVWVLPNPSGLNAHYGLEALARLYAQLREAAGA